jgi:plastocyanin
MFRRLLLSTVCLMLSLPSFADSTSAAHPPTDTTLITNPPRDATGTVLISIKTFLYQPAHFQIKPGDTVRWINAEKRQYHNVWFESLGEPEPPYFFPGEFYERRFDTAGTFPYHCGPHPQMTGSVVVTASEAAPTRPHQDDGQARHWAEAEAYCAALELAGQTDWRLPSVEELQQALRLDPATTAAYWSSTAGLDTRQNPDLVRMLHEYGMGASFEQKYAWWVSATTQTSALKTARYLVRCVRP